MEKGREAGREEEGNGKDVKVMPGCLHPSVVCIYLDPDCRPLKGGLLATPLSPPRCPALISSHPWVNLCSFWKWVGPQWGHIPGDPIHRCVAVLPTSLLTAGPETLNQIHGPDCCLSQARALPCCMAATYLTPQAAHTTSSWDCYTRDSAVFSPNTQPRELRLCVLTLLCSLVSLSF